MIALHKDGKSGNGTAGGERCQWLNEIGFVLVTGNRWMHKRSMVLPYLLYQLLFCSLATVLESLLQLCVPLLVPSSNVCDSVICNLQSWVIPHHVSSLARPLWNAVKCCLYLAIVITPRIDWRVIVFLSGASRYLRLCAHCNMVWPCNR